MANRPYYRENFVDNKGRLGTAELVGAPDFPRPGDPYAGVNLAEKFAAEIANYPNAQQWIKAREQAGNYTGIHVGDWLPLRANNVDFHAQIMGIDTYTGYGDDGHVVGHHIDWILNYLWPTGVKMNLANYNNGLIPVETVSADGTATTFVLTKEMDEVAKIESGGTELSGWTYDADTFTITFEEAPAAGTLTVTGTGTENPWLATNGYRFANSLAGQVPNGAGLNPAVKRVDYTHDGIYYYLPQEWKDIIIPKRFHAAMRYSSSGLLKEPNNYGYVDLGNIWTLNEVEFIGHGCWAANGYCTSGAAQYPLFVSKLSPMQTADGDNRVAYLLDPVDGGQNVWSYIYTTGWIGKSYNASATNYMPVCFRT